MVNRPDENLGEIHKAVIDAGKARVTNAVFSFVGFVGKGDRLFACLGKPSSSPPLSISSSTMKYGFEVACLTLPGMGEVATLGGSVMVQTHG